jgi:hypothetical protein
MLGLVGFVGPVQAADQTILGKRLLVKDPKPGVDATKRTVIGKAQEKGSPDTIVGDPTVAGGVLTVFTRGATPSSQTYALPPALWAPVNGGFKYKDAKLTAGPVKAALVKVAKGTFQLQAAMSGKAGGIDVVPPNPGSDACLRFEIAGGDRYDALFPAPPNATIKRNDAKIFRVQDALVEGSCHAFCAGASGCGWQDGDMVTYNPDNWGTLSTAASTNLSNNFYAVYPGGGVEIGIGGPAGFSALFTSASAVLDYQPADGSPAPLDNDLQDPVSTSSGVFGGHVLAVQLDVDFSDTGHLNGSANLHFGDLRVCGLTATPGFNGSTVRQVLGSLNQALGGAATPYSYDDLAALASDLAQSFESGSASLFAQQHLFNASSCP